jgi:Flp pilus assembly protein TadD
MQKGEYDKAIADYTEALRLDPKNSIFYSDRGYAYGQKGDTARANADYARARELKNE